MVRQGLRSFLNQENDFQVVAEAEDGRQAVAMADAHTPDVIVMDFAMPLLNGMEAMRQILRKNRLVKVVILSAHNDEAYVRQVIELGASGYLIKQSAATTLTSAIRKVVLGELVFSPELLPFNTFIPGDRTRMKGSCTDTKAPRLTSRETEVLQLVAEGKANKQSAALLNISMKTVEKHRQNVMRKLGIHDTAGLTRYAIGHGIAEPLHLDAPDDLR